VLGFIAFAVSFVFCASDASALAQRTFVASYGNDANLCSLSSPCRGFEAAVAAVDDGGEVIVLDSGGYGPVTIIKNVTIAAPSGVYAGITVFAGNGVTINSGPGVVVTLRNLTIVGLGGASGIVAIGIGKLRIEGVRVTGFSEPGLLFATIGTLTVTDSNFERNAKGIEIEPPAFPGAATTVIIQNSQLTRNVVGYRQAGPGETHAAISGTNASANGETGFVSTGIASDRMVLESCVAAENGFYGVYNAAGKLVLSGNSITGNAWGVYVYAMGTAETRGNNTVIQNVTDVLGTLTPIPADGT
jgi:hypothetical protein